MIYLTGNLPAVLESIEKININTDNLGRFEIDKKSLLVLLVSYTQALSAKEGKSWDNLKEKIAQAYANQQDYSHLESADNALNAVHTLHALNAVNDANASKEALKTLAELNTKNTVEAINANKMTMLEKLKIAKKIIISEHVCPQSNDIQFHFALIDARNNEEIVKLSYPAADKKQQLSVLQLKTSIAELEKKFADNHAINFKILENQLISLGNQSMNKAELIKKLISAVQADFGIKEEINIMEVGLYKPEEIIVETITSFRQACRDAITHEDYDMIAKLYAEALSQNEQSQSKYIYITPKNRHINSLQQDINVLLLELHNKIDTVQEEHADALNKAINHLFLAGAHLNDLVSELSYWKNTQLVRAAHFKFPPYKEKLIHSFSEQISRQDTSFRLLPAELMRLILSYVPIEYVHYFNLYVESVKNQNALGAVASFFNYERYAEQNKKLVTMKPFFNMVTDKSFSNKELLDKLEFLPNEAISYYIKKDIDHYSNYAQKNEPGTYIQDDWMELTDTIIIMYQKNIKALLEKQNNQMSELVKLLDNAQQQNQIDKISQFHDQEISAIKVSIEEIDQKINKLKEYPLLTMLVEIYFNAGKKRSMRHLYEFSLENKDQNNKFLQFFLEHDLSYTDIFFQELIVPLITAKEKNDVAKLCIKTYFEKIHHDNSVASKLSKNSKKDMKNIVFQPNENDDEAFIIAKRSEIAVLAIEQNNIEIVEFILESMTPIQLIEQVILDGDKMPSLTLDKVWNYLTGNNLLKLIAEECVILISKLASIALKIKTTKHDVFRFLFSKPHNAAELLLLTMNDEKLNSFNEDGLRKLKIEQSQLGSVISPVILELFISVLKEKNGKLLQSFTHIFDKSYEVFIQQGMIRAIHTHDLELAKVLLRFGVPIDFLKPEIKEAYTDLKLQITQKSVDSPILEDLKKLLQHAAQIDEILREQEPMDIRRIPEQRRNEFYRLFKLVKKTALMNRFDNEPALTLNLTLLILRKMEKMLRIFGSYDVPLAHLINLICFNKHEQDIGFFMRECAKKCAAVPLIDFKVGFFDSKLREEKCLVEIINKLADTFFPVKENNNNISNNIVFK